MTNNSYPRVFIVAAILVAVYAAARILILLYHFVGGPILDVVPPFAIAFGLAFLLDPFVDWLERHGASRGFGVALVGLCFLVVFLAFCLITVPKIADQAKSLGTNFQGYWNQAGTKIDSVLLGQRPFLQKLHLPTTVKGWSGRFSSEFGGAAGPGITIIGGALGSVVSRLMWIIIIPITTLYFLKDMDHIRAKVVHFTPENHRDRVLGLSAAVGNVFAKYVRGMVAVAILYSCVTIAVLTGFGLQYGLIIGAISGLVYLVPYVGVFTIALFIGIAATVQAPDHMAYAGLLVGLLLLQSFVIFDLLITPRLVGGSVGVHPVLALFSLALGAKLFGVVGMVTAVPVAAALQVALGQIFPKINDRVDTLQPDLIAKTRKSEKQKEH